MFPGTLRLAALCCALLATIGCGATAPQPPPRPLQPLQLVLPSDGVRPDLAVIRRGGGDLVRLSLWIDAGARDATPSQVATVAAWLAEARAGEHARAEVWPDAIEIATPCRKRDLRDCMARLSRTLALREAQAAALGTAKNRLADARRASTAKDPGRRADELALHALYGDAGDTLLPFGHADDDARASRAAGVQEFMAAHFGVRRALLIAIGDLDADTVARDARIAFARLPAATHARAEHALDPAPGGGVAVDVDNRAALSLALGAPDLERARAAADALARRLQRDVPNTSVRGHVFAVRGTALALLRVSTAEPLAVAQAAAHEVERLRHEQDAVAPAEAADADADAWARRLALRWATRSSARPGVELGLGIGMLVAGGRADRIGDTDPDAALRARWQDRAQEAFASGRALGAPRTHGSVDAQAAQVTLDNGVRVVLRQRASEQVTVALRFARSAGSEPPLLHGRAALLATLTSSACAGLSPEQLDERLHALGARLTPRVDAESWGLLLTAPEVSWQPALGLALDCALHPALDRATLATARLRLRSRLGTSLGPEALLAAAAEWLAPGAPGTLAPWGSPDRQASVGLAELRELWSASRRGALMSIAALGPLPIEAALGVIARRAAELPAGPALEVAAPAHDGGIAEPGQPIAQPTFGLALWRVPMAGADAAGAQAFAAVARAALSQTAGVTASWHAGGADAAGGWAAVALSGPAPSLLAITAQLDALVRAAPATSVERAADLEFDLAEQARAAATSDPGVEAETLARAAFSPPVIEAKREGARAVAAKLARAEATWLPLR